MSMLFRCLFLVVVVAIPRSEGGGRLLCPDIIPPRWGEVDCDKGSERGSTCILSCEKHYDLDGTTESSIETVCGDDWTWSISTEFVCNPIRCLPLPHSPENGDRICSANTLAESLCVIYCDRHFDMKEVTTDRTAYTVCKDDGDGDEFGQWEGVGDLPTPPTARPMCEQLKCPYEHQAPENGKMVCSSGSYVGSFCVFACNIGYDFVGTRKVAINSYCIDDGNYDNVGKWTQTRIPKCKKCKRVKDLQIVAMIHESEGDVSNYNLAAKLVARIMTVLKRKYRSSPTLKVNRYSSMVDASAEVVIKSFQSIRDKAKIAAVPYPGSDENLEKALIHVSDSLNEGGVRVAMIISNGMNSDEKAEKLAEDLRKRGVIIFVVILPRNGDGEVGSEADIVKIAGDKSRVFKVMSGADAEDVKNKVSKMISDTAIQMGCKIKS